ncbi:MAG: response regulator [Opitutales bacterium]
MICNRPAAESVNASGLPSNDVEADAAPQDVELDGTTVLLADDTDNVRSVARRFRREAGAVVVEARNGGEALAALERGTLPDLVLLDLHMPGLDGYRTAAALRANAFRGPIIALTADVTESSQRRATEAGCNTYLLKPLDRRNLLSLVRDKL